jgi:hypothetical protein
MAAAADRAREPGESDMSRRIGLPSAPHRGIA